MTTSKNVGSCTHHSRTPTPNGNVNVVNYGEEYDKPTKEKGYNLYKATIILWVLCPGNISQNIRHSEHHLSLWKMWVSLEVSQMLQALWYW